MREAAIVEGSPLGNSLLDLGHSGLCSPNAGGMLPAAGVGDEGFRSSGKLN